jgi:hypothetical protein
MARLTALAAAAARRDAMAAEVRVLSVNVGTPRDFVVERNGLGSTRDLVSQGGPALSICAVPFACEVDLVRRRHVHLLWVRGSLRDLHGDPDYPRGIGTLLA